MTQARPDAATYQAVLQALSVVGPGSERLDTAFRSALAPAFPAGHPLRIGHAHEADTAALVLGSMMQAVRRGLDQPEAVEACWQRLGASWAAQGVGAADLALVGQLWFRAVRQVCSDGWSSSVSSGWAAFELWMLHHLGRGSALVPVPPPPRPQRVRPAPTAPTDDEQPDEQPDEQGAAAGGAEVLPGPERSAHRQPGSRSRDARDARGSDLYRAWGRSWT